MPGTVLAQRYRIVGLLGRGGMGEVYRADDLTLGQQVALKFLPESKSQDPQRVEGFLSEVRLARQIAHPNVCRVYDVGEVDGQRYLSMEYVDGEDLASLLRRIGRLPHRKGVEIARQLTAGLGAAHERGVVHHDLKPANVMIDGRGRVRITDFGLAVLLSDAREAEEVAGTPAYMAPEQLRGQGVTPRSDLYALGLILYEIFTGERLHNVGSIAELIKLHEEDTVSKPSDRVPDLDPAVERVILHCLEREPSRRPASALAVAAALPGGDPLQAALAAGETPSPEMVAAAGGEGALSPKTATALLALIVVGLFLAVYTWSHIALLAHVPLDKSPAVLAERSREILARLGHSTTPAVDVEYDFGRDDDYLRYQVAEDRSSERWKSLPHGRPAAIYFWYRQSPRHLLASRGGFAIVGPDSPPLRISGEARVVVDTQGRLLRLDVVPPERDDAPGARSLPDWSLLFAEAGLGEATFQRVEPVWAPPYDVDEKAAWEGEFPELPGTRIRLEAAVYRGRVVFFRVIGPWTRPQRLEAFDPGRLQRISQAIALAVNVVVFLAAILLARRNVRLGRGDRRGAFRLAFWFLVVHTAVWALWADHVPVPEEWALLQWDVGFNLFLTLEIWVFYVAVEPYVRRRWPEILISWSRLLAGRFRDPRIGRDVLVGLATGMVLALLSAALYEMPIWLGLPPPKPPGSLSSLTFWATGILDQAVHSVFDGMIALGVLFLLRVLLRHRVLAGAGLVVVATLVNGLRFEHPEVALFCSAAMATIIVTNLIRYGLVAAVVAFYSSSLFVFPLTTDTGAWYVLVTYLVIATILILAVLGFRSATAGRRLFGDDFLEN